MEQDLFTSANGAVDLAADDAACDLDLPLDNPTLADHELGPRTHGAFDPPIDAKIAGKLELTADRAS
jgi:hypothetical protein